MLIMRHIRIALLMVLAAFAVVGCAKQPPTAEPVTPWSPLPLSAEDKKIIVAKVNDVDITRYSLIDMMNRMSALNQRTSVPEPGDSIRKRALDQLVLQELALQEATRQGLRVEESMVDRAMERTISRLGHEEGYRAFLERQHINSIEFRAQVERSMLVQLILTREIVDKAVVSDEDVRKEYDRTSQIEKNTSFEEAKGAIKAKLRSNAQLKRRQEWETDLKKGAKIEFLDASDKLEQRKQQP